MIDSRTEDVGCARLLQQITGHFFVMERGKSWKLQKEKTKSR